MLISQDVSRIERMSKTDIYLGILQSKRTNHTAIKKQLEEEFVKRLQAILKTKLNMKNITKFINTYAVTALT